MRPFQKTSILTTVLVVLLAGCANKPVSSPSPGPSLLAQTISFEYAIYLLPTSAKADQALQILREEISSRHPTLKLVEQFPPNPTSPLVRVHVEKNVQKNFRPLDLNSHGDRISELQAQGLSESQEALILQFAHPGSEVWTGLRTATEVVEEVARKSRGLVWDEETRQTFSPDSWHKRRLDSWVVTPPDVASHIVIHAYSNGDYARSITLGMTKFGLPDVVIQNSTWADNGQVGSIINAFCQLLAEDKRPSGGKFKLDLRAISNPRVRVRQTSSLKTNATQLACLTVREAKLEPGDNDNRLIELDSDQYEGDDELARQQNMIAGLFGTEDSIQNIQDNDELLAASAKAKTRLPDLQKAFNAGLEPGAYIELKAPFKTPTLGTEWMWVEVTKWNGNQIQGVLDNDPFKIPTLHSGDVVHIQQDEVFDYIWRHADKSEEGNTTSAIIEKMNDASPGKKTSDRKLTVPCG